MTLMTYHFVSKFLFLEYFWKSYRNIWNVFFFYCFFPEKLKIIFYFFFLFPTGRTNPEGERITRRYGDNERSSEFVKCRATQWRFTTAPGGSRSPLSKDVIYQPRYTDDTRVYRRYRVYVRVPSLFTVIIIIIRRGGDRVMGCRNGKPRRYPAAIRAPPPPPPPPALPS